MEVDDLELLELVNDYQRRSDEPTFNTLDDIPEAQVNLLGLSNGVMKTQNIELDSITMIFVIC